MPTNETEIPFGPSTIETIDYAVWTPLPRLPSRHYNCTLNVVYLMRCLYFYWKFYNGFTHPTIGCLGVYKLI